MSFLGNRSNQNVTLITMVLYDRFEQYRIMIDEINGKKEVNFGLILYILIGGSIVQAFQSFASSTIVFGFA